MLFTRFHKLGYGTRQCPAKSTKHLHMTCWMKTRPIHGSQLISPTHHIIQFTYIHTYVNTVVDPSHRQCFWDQSSFSGDTHRSSNRWLPPLPRTSWTRPPLLSSLGSRTLESKTPQQVEDYINKLQSLGRHMQLQKFRTWLNEQCGLPIEVRPNNLNTQEYMKKDQIEQRIDEWTKKHAKGNEQRVLKNFLMMDFAVQPNPKMQPCSNCEQQFMLFMLLPMKQHNMNTYDPDEHRLFCYNCCTEVGHMLHPGRYVPPDQQATERQKALNQNPPGMTMAECELRALSGDRGYLPPTWYLATPPNSAIPPDHAIILHRWDTETSQWIKLPLTKAGHRCITVLSTRLAKVDPHGVADQASTLPTGTPDKPLHHIQEPARCYHRVTTEPLQDESRLGPFGPPGIPCHTSRHRSLDLGATTTPTIGESLRRVGENQFHPHGDRPQQWPIGLHQSQRQHSTPARLPGGGAPEPPPTLHLSEHRVQLCHQSITLDQLDHTNQAGQIPLSQMPHRVSTMGWQRC